MTAEKIDKSKLKRTTKLDDKAEKDPEPVSNPIDRVIDLAFNPTREKIREMTNIDRLQGRYFPILDTASLMMKYCIKIAFYRQDAREYASLFEEAFPIPPDMMDEFTFRTAQWQKSVGAKNLDKAIDIALAETEARMEEGEGLGESDW